METWCRWENARKGSSCGLDRIHWSDGAGTQRTFSKTLSPIWTGNDLNQRLRTGQPPRKEQEMAEQVLDGGALIETRPVGPAQWTVIGLCACVAMLDGLDLQSIGL